jgi:hypothetical protein
MFGEPPRESFDCERSFTFLELWQRSMATNATTGLYIYILNELVSGSLKSGEARFNGRVEGCGLLIWTGDWLSTNLDGSA